MGNTLFCVFVAIVTFGTTPYNECINGESVYPSPVEPPATTAPVSTLSSSAPAFPGTTQSPATLVPVTTSPATVTTSPPATISPITSPSNTLAAPVTPSPITMAPATPTPVTTSPPVTQAPMTSSPMALTPITAVPATNMPVTPAPNTASPVTLSPVAPCDQNTHSVQVDVDSGDFLVITLRCLQGNTIRQMDLQDECHDLCSQTSTSQLVCNSEQGDRSRVIACCDEPGSALYVKVDSSECDTINTVLQALDDDLDGSIDVQGDDCTLNGQQVSCNIPDDEMVELSFTFN